MNIVIKHNQKEETKKMDIEYESKRKEFADFLESIGEDIRDYTEKQIRHMIAEGI